MDYPVPVLAIYGARNSGKSILTKRLVAELEDRGIRVMSVKGLLHEQELERPRMDAWRHQRSGSQVSMLTTPGGWLVDHQSDDRVSLTELAEEAERRKCEVLIVEGFEDADVPKIEVTPRNIDTYRIDQIADMLIDQIGTRN
ncbi:MAG: molybdopterin-guanine dinucleotide biosynthesis protein B [Actinomycetia bacterium]|nr:molybdopterin-guanine dinucleotide biosynthesis protein B [Actinomycetes bacterium]